MPFGQTLRAIFSAIADVNQFALGDVVRVCGYFIAVTCSISSGFVNRRCNGTPYRLPKGTPASYLNSVSSLRRTFRTTFRDMPSSRQIALIDLPYTRESRRIFRIVSTTSIQIKSNGVNGQAPLHMRLAFLR